RVRIGDSARYSRPYWHLPRGSDRYELDVPAFEGLPWSPPDVVARFGYRLDGVDASLEEAAIAPAPGRWAGSEKQKVVGVVPALSVQLAPAVAIIPAGAVPMRRELTAT